MSASPLSPSRPRFGWLDAARGIAALSVMAQHALERGGIETLVHGGIATMWFNMGEIGVAIFFLVSGFIIPASVQPGASARDFWVRRALRIYPLYWFVFALTLLLSALLLRRPIPHLGPTIASHAVFVQEWIDWPNFVGGAWTLFIELIWYIGFSLLFFTRLARGVRLVWLGIAGYAAAILLLWVVWPTGPFGRLSLLALCVFGYAYLLRTEGRLSARHFAIVAACFLGLIALSLFVGFYLYPSDAIAEPAFACVAVSWSIALATFAMLWRHKHSAIADARALRWLGEISFSVYLLHAPVMIVLGALGLSGVPFVIATFAVTIPLAAVTFRVIERPGLRLARRLTRRRERPIVAEVAAVARGHAA